MPVTSTDLIQQLTASGLNYADIGAALGRDRSLVRQVGIGAKPGNNMRAALESLQARLATVTHPDARKAVTRSTSIPPARRTTKAGTTARVRKSMTHKGRGYSTGTVKQQAARGKGGALPGLVADAAGQGRTVAVTVGFDKRVTVNGTSGGRRARTGAGGWVEMELGSAASVQAAANAQHGGNVSAYVAAQAIERGYVSGVADERDAVAHMTSLELRTY